MPRGAMCAPSLSAGSLMFLSTPGRGVRGEGSALLKHGPENVDAAPGERDDRLMVMLAFLALARIEGFALRAAQRGEGRLVEDALQSFVASAGAAQKAHLARLAKHGCKACCGGERVSRFEALDGAYLGDEFSGKQGPHAGQAADEGRIRVAGKARLDLGIQCAELFLGAKGFARKVLDDAGGEGFARQADRLALGTAASGIEERSSSGKIAASRSCMRFRRRVCSSLRSRRRDTSSRSSMSSSEDAVTARRSRRVRT